MIEETEVAPGVVRLGKPLRDAAVDPRPGDFLAPVNAGEADPHGPLVVSAQATSPRSGQVPNMAGGRIPDVTLDALVDGPVTQPGDATS